MYLVPKSTHLDQKVSIGTKSTSLHKKYPSVLKNYVCHAVYFVLCPETEDSERYSVKYQIVCEKYLLGQKYGGRNTIPHELTYAEFLLYYVVFIESSPSY